MKEFVKSHPAFVFTAIYIVASIQSIVYNSHYYKQFNIDILKYISLNDLFTLLFSFGILSLFNFTILSFLFIVVAGQAYSAIKLYNKLDEYSRLKKKTLYLDQEENSEIAKINQLKKRTNRSVRIGVILTGVIIAIIAYNFRHLSDKAESIKKGGKKNSFVEFKFSSQDTFFPYDSLYHIGSTSNHYFVYSKKRNKTLIVPVSKVDYIINNNY